MLIAYKHILQTLNIMKIISPLTLLIVPLIGSLIIISFPYLTDKDKKVYCSAAVGDQVYNPRLTQAATVYLSLTPLAPQRRLASNEKTEIGNGQHDSVSALLAKKSASAINELIQIPVTEKKNSNLKKIAIITSLVNFIISIIL